MDYTPQKGAWETQTRTIVRTHIDDYMTLLRTHWVPLEEIEKKHGIVDDHRVMVKINDAESSNVILLEHYPNLSAMDPDRVRDDAVKREGDAFMSPDANRKMGAGIDSYRRFSSDALYRSYTLTK